MTVAAGLKITWLLLWHLMCGEEDLTAIVGLVWETSSFLIASSAMQICLPALGTLGQRTMMRRRASPRVSLSTAQHQWRKVSSVGLAWLQLEVTGAAMR